MRSKLAVLLLLLPLNAFAGDLQKAIADIPEYDLERHDSDLHTLASAAAESLTRAVSAHKDVVQALQRDLHISAAAARPLAEAVALNLALEWNGGDAREVDALFREALKEEPKNAAAIGAYIEFMARQRELFPDFAASALPYSRLLSAHEAASLAVSLYGDRMVIVVADALRIAPDNIELLKALADDGTPAIRAAFIDPRWNTDAAQSLINALIDLDRPAEALAIADAYPAAVAKTRVNLALAAAVLGQTKRANELLGHAAVDDQNRHFIVLVKTLLDPTADVYDALELQVNAMLNGTGTYTAACVQLARRGGYDRFAEMVLARAWRYPGNEEEALQYLPKELGDKLRRTITARETESEVAIDTPIARLLRAPRIAAFTEHPTQLGRPDCSEVEDLAAKIALPAGLAPIRLERHGEEVAGIAVSQTLDPVGEVGRGGYWVVHSRDDGKTWDEPLYTGLRENMPYVVVPTSRLPLFDDDALYVEVEVRELDLSSITFPPLELRSKREARGLYLEMPWMALRRDSDGDGLPDLLEERIATDPNNRDTDGDGIIDSADGLPQVALTASASADSEVLAQFLKNAGLGGGALIVGLASTEEQRQACVTRASRIGTPALFVTADRAQFSSIDVNRRVVILSPAELALYEEKFGPSYFGELAYVLVRHDGRKAAIFFDQRWAGSVYLMEKTNDGWKVIGGTSYIT